MKRSQGFSLIEIIVVITIISLLSIVGLTAYNRVQMNARDAKRMGDMQELRSALLLYKSIHGRFPDIFDSDCQGWDAASGDSDSDGNFFIDQLALSNILKQVPRDPLVDQTTDHCEGHNADGSNYYYYRYVQGVGAHNTSGCTGVGNFIIVAASNMETSDGRHPQSPGWDKCTRDWHTNFDYVIGLDE